MATQLGLCRRRAAERVAKTDRLSWQVKLTKWREANTSELDHTLYTVCRYRKTMCKTHNGRLRYAELSWAVLGPEPELGTWDFSSPPGRAAAHTGNPEQPRGPRLQTVQTAGGNTTQFKPIRHDLHQTTLFFRPPPLLRLECRDLFG